MFPHPPLCVISSMWVVPVADVSKFCSSHLLHSCYVRKIWPWDATGKRKGMEMIAKWSSWPQVQSSNHYTNSTSNTLGDVRGGRPSRRETHDETDYLSVVKLTFFTPALVFLDRQFVDRKTWAIHVLFVRLWVSGQCQLCWRTAIRRSHSIFSKFKLQMRLFKVQLDRTLM